MAKLPNIATLEYDVTKPNHFFEYLDTRFGTLEICADQDGVTSIRFVTDMCKTSNRCLNTQQAVAQLGEYFAGARTQFSLDLNTKGTNFQHQVWRQLTTIEYGKTLSYADIAKDIGNPKAVRAVGAANGRNPFTIVVPCHRVIGSNGKLTGYAWGTSIKAGLLELEQRVVLSNPTR
ncbi:methylated-DNA--[protein]-cysteine S-methyltransferase [Paraglaciecola psychrophila]|uniref:Methylated-DNA--protein-cysteine methyltransferase n=1 Tax=Paraglaciecola psychrophila 170 TaxID=1129794 RepID=K7AE63_9ALTE|nr:methylated-DNA--[protein]-cysteine S-methyltransferase [Paraglaciecola psychrophila]AGH42695.1 methylated-DNA--protein-cysteine methyltransferase [Paraglaciecola psychrophila 170]GAC38933.1 methylated-DNA-[protein]-cysteine S-methyltransferase [Paraglaciecola psychrophila 170]